MAIRSLTQLLEDQSSLLSAYRATLTPLRTGSEPGRPEARPALQWGQVTQVVTGDPTWGDHLVIQAQVPTGTPPTFAPSPAATLRCYPAPGKTVSDYTVNDYVRLVAADAAVIAERLG